MSKQDVILYDNVHESERHGERIGNEWRQRTTCGSGTKE